MKVALTDCGAVTVSVQVPVPLHAPPQPANTVPVDGTAVSVITLPWVRDTLHAVPQLRPAGADVTVPLPLPSLLSVIA